MWVFLKRKVGKIIHKTENPRTQLNRNSGESIMSVEILSIAISFGTFTVALIALVVSIVVNFVKLNK
ncbi:putative holin-like toxin [Mesobacillus zeae]|uniref:putative holin-like toxin n=1 Tax=Mesobacillus zeae TaxID=1917180 RepID=UPI003AB73CC4